MSDTGRKDIYLAGHKLSQVRHHEWRTVQNSAAHAIAPLEQLRSRKPNFTMLDVGAGSGTITVDFAKLAPEAHITALDMSDDILVRAKEFAVESGVEKNMAFKQGSVYELPFEDDSFDVVHAHQVLCHLNTPVDAVKEILRVARPGGFVALRESDLEMWCMWPESRGLKRFHEVLMQLHSQHGEGTTGGRRLLSWAIAAGAKRENITAGFGTWCFSQQHDKEVWGDAMMQRALNGEMRRVAVEKGLATEGEFNEMVKGWKEWIEAPDAIHGIVNGELIIRIPE